MFASSYNIIILAVPLYVFQIMAGKISQAAIRKVAEQISSMAHCTHLATELGFSEMEVITLTNQTFQRPLTAQRILQEWSSSSKSDTTGRFLSEVLQRIGLHAVAEDCHDVLLCKF